jgi:hypothetical protein
MKYSAATIVLFASLATAQEKGGHAKRLGSCRRRSRETVVNRRFRKEAGINIRLKSDGKTPYRQTKTGSLYKVRGSPFYQMKYYGCVQFRPVTRGYKRGSVSNIPW